MQVGDCPYADCNHPQMRLLPDKRLPLFSKEQCDGCGRTVWVLYSRVDPQIFTVDAFAEKYEVDELSKAIRARAVQG
jgi:hypothetical protein